MRQLFLGISVGVLVSILALFIFLNFSGKEIGSLNTFDILKIGKNSDEIKKTTQENIETETNHIIAIEYIDKNLEEITGNNEEMKNFKEKSSYDFAIILYAIKNKNLQLWNIYWMELYDSLAEKPFQRDIYEENIQIAFEKIILNELVTDDFKEYLLDGAVYFSHNTLENKKQACEDAFHETDTEAPEDGINYCESLSYVFEAIRENDISYCSEISFIPEGTSLIKNCEALFSH